tara:strand:+ start:851 stop:1279 length:429 start_codon:yes stop_codon:yes gene_type:complete
MIKIENKFSIKAETDKNFAKELEKASQAVYKLPYNSLQELPSEGKPSKHYLRKQYIRNKKFIGLPDNLKQLSNTSIYKSEQAALIIDAYKTLKKINKNYPTASQIRDYLNKKTGSTKDNRKFIKKILSENCLDLSRGKATSK